MSLAATLANALSGLTVAQRALSVTANNIANANTEGYVRKVLSQEAVFVGSRGAGVQASEISRITDQFLAAEVRRQASVVGRSEILGRYHDLLQDAFGAPGDGRDLAARVSELGAALEAFANNPESATLALQVIQAAGDLSATFGQLAEYVQVLRGQADEDIGRAVAEINGELQAIHDLNAEIERLSHLGQVGPELLDHRDALIGSLAEKIDISTFVQEGDRIAIYAAGGETLLDALPRVLAYNPAAAVAHDTPFDRIAIFREDQIDPATGQPIDPSAGIELVSSGLRASLTPELQNDAIPDTDQLITSRLRGGSLQGLLEARDLVLPELDDQIQELADNLRFALNAGHNDGNSRPPPAQLTGTRIDLLAFAGATRSGSATIAVVDRTDGSTVAAFQIDLGAVADEVALAAQIDGALGALGSATIGLNGDLQISLSAPDQGVAIAEGDSQITITDATGRDRTYGFAHYFGLNDLFVLSGNRPSTLAVRPDIASDPARLSSARLDVQTGPLVATLGGRGDNRAAQALAATLGAEHDFLARGGLPGRPATLAAYAADLVAHAAMRAQHAADTAGRDRALADALEFRTAAVSGVNLDEEMARMIELQQAYSVAARIISVTDELFDELLGTVSYGGKVMLTRVGDFAQHQRMTQLLLDAQTRARETQVRIGTGKVAQRFREAPDADRLLATKDTLRQISQYRANNELVAKRLEVMESSVGSLHEVGARLRVLLIQRLDDGSAVPGVITPELQHLLEQAVSDLNVDFEGRFLFSGTRTGTAPVVLDPAFAGFGGPDDTYYQGDAVALSVRVDTEREIAYGMTADRPGFQELIGALRAALEGDASDDRALLENALGLVNAALPKVADYRSELGAGQAALARINRGHGDAEVYLERQISDIENVDLTEAITRMTQDQMVIESAMATIARLNQVTLADFLR